MAFTAVNPPLDGGLIPYVSDAVIQRKDKMVTTQLQNGGGISTTEGLSLVRTQGSWDMLKEPH